MRYWFSMSSPTARTHVPEVIDVVDRPLAVLEIDEVADRLEDVALREHGVLERLVELELVVQSEAADLGQVVALGVKNRLLKRFCAGLDVGGSPGAGAGRSP